VSDYEAFFDASCSTLRFYDFPPDRVDRTRGLIISRPTTSGQWFEWWRADSRGGYQTLESSLHTMRRIVTVTLAPLDQQPEESPGAPTTLESQPTTTQAADVSEEPAAPISGRYRVTVQADKSRYEAPERQVTTASGALAMFSEKTPTVEGLRGPASRSVHWVPLGRDALLEEFLLAELSKALPGVTPADESSAAACTAKVAP
jgi:hypothetical protein